MLITAAPDWRARPIAATRLEQVRLFTDASTRIPGQTPTIPLPLSLALATPATAVPCSSEAPADDVETTWPLSSKCRSAGCESATASIGLRFVTGGGVSDW